MKAVVDRVVQYPNRYKLTNAETNEVLGVFDFIPEMGTIQVVGTPINKELFDSIKTDIEAKLTASGGDSKDLMVTFTEATIRANISSKETHATIFGKIKKWFADLKALAFKDKVSNADISTDADIDKSKIKGAVLLTGTADPTTDTVGVVGQLYRNTTSGQVFMCTAVGENSYTWEDYAKNKANADASNLTNENIASWAKKFFPIGSIYISTNETSPASIYGGTWEQIKDRFLLGTGDTYANGDTGGSANAVVVAHGHSYKAVTTTSTSHTHNNFAQHQIAVAPNNVYWEGRYDSGIYQTGVDGTGKNMPPYLAVYMWKRIA